MSWFPAWLSLILSWVMRMLGASLQLCKGGCLGWPLLMGMGVRPQFFFSLWFLVRILSISLVSLGCLFLGHLARESRVLFLCTYWCFQVANLFISKSDIYRRQKEDPKNSPQYCSSYLVCLLSLFQILMFVLCTMSIFQLYFAGGIRKSRSNLSS